MWLRSVESSVRPIFWLRFALLVLLSWTAGPIWACTYNDHCPSMCDGSKLVERDCTAQYKCEAKTLAPLDCARTEQATVFSVTGKKFDIPQTCLLTDTGARCGPDKESSVIALSVECIQVSETLINISEHREMLLGVKTKAVEICRDLLEDSTIDLGVNIAFLGAGLNPSSVIRGMSDLARALASEGFNQAMSRNMQTNFTRKASKDLNKWVEKLKAGKVTKADMCTLQEEMRDVIIPTVERARSYFSSQGKICREQRVIFDGFPEPIVRPTDIDLDPRDPPEDPEPPPENKVAVPQPTKPSYKVRCPCSTPGTERVPYVTGLSINGAISQLDKCNLIPSISGSEYGGKKPDTVLSQRIHAGECIAPREAVGLVRSLGPASIQALKVRPAAARISTGQTIAYDLRIIYADGREGFGNYEVRWKATLDGRAIPMDINKFTPHIPGDYVITAQLDGFTASTTVTVAPARTTIGRGNWNVYCTFEGSVVALEGYSTGTMEGPFKTQQEAEGWIGVHCPTRTCDRAFSCLSTSSKVEQDNTGDWSSGEMVDGPSVTPPEQAWGGGRIEEPSICETPAEQRAVISSAIQQLQQAISQPDQYVALLNAVEGLLASSQGPDVCPSEKTQIAVLLQRVQAAQAADRNNAREANNAAMQEGLVQQRRRSEAWASLASGLTATLQALQRAQSSQQQTSSPHSTSTSTGAANGGATQRTAGSQGNSSQCAAMQQQLSSAVQKWQSLLTQRPVNDVGGQWCRQVMTWQNNFISLLRRARDANCVNISGQAGLLDSVRSVSQSSCNPVN